MKFFCKFRRTMPWSRSHFPFVCTNLILFNQSTRNDSILLPFHLLTHRKHTNRGRFFCSPLFYDYFLLNIFSFVFFFFLFRAPIFKQNAHAIKVCTFKFISTHLFFEQTERTNGIKSKKNHFIIMG